MLGAAQRRTWFTPLIATRSRSRRAPNSAARPRERRPFPISVLGGGLLGSGDRQVSSQGAFEFLRGSPRERRPLLLLLGRGDRQVNSQGAFEFSCSLVSPAAHAVAQPRYL